MPGAMPAELETIRTRTDGGVLFATFDAPPLNLIGPEVVRDLAALITALDTPAEIRAVVFDSADPDFFLPHVDLGKVAESTAEAARTGGPGDASLGMLFQRFSRLPVVTIGKLRGRARGAGASSCSRAMCVSPRVSMRSSGSRRWASALRLVPAASSGWPA